MIYFCCEEKRRSAVRNYQPPTTGATAGQDINGIDYLEVVDHEEPDLTERQRLLKNLLRQRPRVAVAGESANRHLGQYPHHRWRTNDGNRGGLESNQPLNHR